MCGSLDAAPDRRRAPPARSSSARSRHRAPRYDCDVGERWRRSDDTLLLHSATRCRIGLEHDRHACGYGAFARSSPSALPEVDGGRRRLDERSPSSSVLQPGPPERILGTPRHRLRLHRGRQRGTFRVNAGSSRRTERRVGPRAEEAIGMVHAARGVAFLAGARRPEVGRRPRSRRAGRVAGAPEPSTSSIRRETTPR